MTERPQPTQEQRDPRIDEAMQLLDAGLERVMNAEGFKAFLEAQAHLYTYSPKNQLLIWTQKHDATLVNSFDRWKKLGRHVLRGERGLKVFVPMLRDEVDRETGEIREVLTGFRLGNVFDVSQTGGKPLPELPRAQELEGNSEHGKQLFADTNGWLCREQVGLSTLLVIPDMFGMPSDAKGMYVPGEHPQIYVREGMGWDQSSKTLVHESGHYVADKRGFVIPSREDRETIAESAAFVVAHKYGVDTGDYSFNYVAGWAGDKARFQQNLGFIQSTAKAIIGGIESVASREPRFTPPQRDLKPGAAPTAL